jgi:hypothetical protein
MIYLSILFKLLSPSENANRQESAISRKTCAVKSSLTPKNTCIFVLYFTNFYHQIDWKKDPTGDFDWIRTTGATVTPGTGPSYDQ